MSLYLASFKSAVSNDGPYKHFYSMDASGHTSVEHPHSSFHAWIREDINNSRHIHFDLVVETLFGLSAARMKKWVSIIAKEKWHQDPELCASLEAFCSGDYERSRCEPFSKIANRVARMAHGRLPDVPDVYPIDGICVERNTPNYIETIESQDGLGARRAPGCLVLRARQASKLNFSLQTQVRTKVSKPQDPSSRDHGRRSHRTARTSAATEHGPRRMTTRASARKSAFTAPQAESPLDDDAASAKDDVSASDSDRNIVRSKGKGTESHNIRWVDIIMNVEFTGRTSSRNLLRVFLVDRNERFPSSPSDSTMYKHGAPVRTRGGRGGLGRRTGGARGAAAAHTRSESKEEAMSARKSLKRRHRFDDKDEDDLLYHIRRPDPPAWTLESGSDDTPERFSYDVKMAAIQTCSYALETLACTFGTRLFCVNIFVKNDRLYLWYYDACGYLYTESISVVADFEKTVALLVAIACSSPAQLGALPTFVQPTQDAPYPQNWPPESLKDHSLTIPFSISSAGVQTSEGMHITLAEPVF